MSDVSRFSFTPLKVYCNYKINKESKPKGLGFITSIFCEVPGCWSIVAAADKSISSGPASDRMIYIIMGVSGSGKFVYSLFIRVIDKSTYSMLGWPLHEGDDFHPQENIEKMARGEPLTDQDRLPWLLKVHGVIERERCSNSNVLVVCSALKRHYRQILLFGSTVLPSSSSSHQDIMPPSLPNVFFLYLHGDYDLIHKRILARKGHYMKADLLQSQFDDLEPPFDEENVLVLDIRKSVTDIALEVEAHMIRQMTSSALKP